MAHTIKLRFREGETVRHRHTGERLTIDEDEGGDRVQVAHADGSYSYLPRWQLEPVSARATD
jgi:hypothetical protein